MMLKNTGRNKMLAEYEKNSKLSFGEILLKEPRLISVINQAKEKKDITPSNYVEKNKFWYKVLKPKMIKLVGFGAENTELSSTEIYELTYRFFIELLEI